MKFHSIKTKLVVILAVIVASIVGLICLLNLTLFEKYYYKNKADKLESSYKSLKSDIISGEYSNEDIIDEIHHIYARHNITVFVIDGNWNTVYSSQSFAQIRWFMDIRFDKNAKYDVVKETSDYSIVKGYDKGTHMSYLGIYGTLDDSSQIFMQITIESIDENISSFNKFVLLVGVFILLLGIIIVFFIANRFVKPIKQLSVIAASMSELDFDAKYDGRHKDEIGVLGHSMNTLSEKLEHNISELKKVNLELQKDIEHKNKNEEMRREFLSNVSHELKTPIALIQGYAEGLKEGISDDPESMEYYCDVIIDESAKMSNMVKKLLTLNQIEFGSDPLNIERFNFTSMVEDIVKSNSIRFEQNQIKVEFDRKDNVEIWADQYQIEEVLTNYISNAINHCEGSKIIRISIISYPDKMSFKIFNTGNHIPEEDIDRIWEKFYKVDKARTREYGGNGIGLSIVKAILDNHKAAFGAQNVEGGVEFYFDIQYENI